MEIMSHFEDHISIPHNSRVLFMNSTSLYPNLDYYDPFNRGLKLGTHGAMQARDV